MTPETREFLALVRHAEAPSQQDEERVLRALRASAAAGLTTTAVFSASGRDGWLVKLGQVISSTATKLSFIAVGTALGLSLGHDPTRTPPSDLQSLPPAMSAARAPAAVVIPPLVGSTISPPPAPPSAAASANLRPPRRPVASLRGELSILEKAQRALKAGDSEAALRELDAARESNGPLRAERQATRILALCSAGKAEEARLAFARFLVDYPDSAHRTAIVDACTISSTD